MNTTTKQYTIQVTVLFEQPFWVGIFERNDAAGYAVARQIFGSEPTDPELYEFVTTHYYDLKFTQPNNNIKLTIKRKNFKRVSREVRKIMQKLPAIKKETRAQEALRLDLEKNKKLRKITSKAEKEVKNKEKFALKQEKKKKKHRGY